MNFFQKIQIGVAEFSLAFFNAILNFFRILFFRNLNAFPKKILVYKLGNIGDVICAMPVFAAIRNNFPQAEIILLSSPGRRGAPGAGDLLKHSRVFDRLRVYYSDEISSWIGAKKIWRELRQEKFDLFIQLPDDWANFRTLARNLFFARSLGVKTAFGFVLRTSNVFKKTQADYLPLQKNEIQSLLAIVGQYGIKPGENIFDFGKTDLEKEAAIAFLNKSFGGHSMKLIGLNLSAKRPAKEWGDANFLEVAAFLQKKGDYCLVFFGGPNDRERNDNLIKSLPRPDRAFNAAGLADLLTARELMRFCLFLLSNDTGAVHLAASANVPVLGLYSIQSLLGKWYPYGDHNIILAHRFAEGDYHSESGVAASMKKISVGEVIAACEKMLGNID